MQGLMMSRCILTILSIFAWALSPSAAERPDVVANTSVPAQLHLGVGVDSQGRLVKQGRPVRAIGVNYFDAFLRTLHKPDDTSYDQGFRTLADLKIPFARFAACGFWPNEMRLYQSDKAEYFRRLDSVIHSAESHGIGLIPSLFWCSSTVPDLVGEPCDQWGNPESKTQQFMRDYTRDVATRYRRSPAIWGWEFGNEYNLVVDLPDVPSHLPKVVPQRGTPSTRSSRDRLTLEMLRTALAEFAKEVRRHDPDRFITSGHSMPRPSAWHLWKEGKWTADGREQFLEVFQQQHPDPINVMSIHVYADNMPRLALALEAAPKAEKPLMVGEFGISGPSSPENDRALAALLAEIERSRVSLAAAWVFDYAAQEPQHWNITATNQHTNRLKMIAEANRRLRAASQQAVAATSPASEMVDRPDEPVLEKPTLHCLGAYWIIAGDAKQQSRIDMAYRKAGQSEWQQGMPMFRVRNGDTTQTTHDAQLNPAADACLMAGSIVGLTPDTDYEIKLTVIRPDVPAVEKVLHARTAAEPTDVLQQRICHVSPGNGGGDGSEKAPYQGLAYAQTHARPGTVFLVHPGVYQGTFRVDRSGEPQRPIVWRGNGDGEAVILGEDKQTGIVAEGVHDVRLEKLSVRRFYLGIGINNSSQIAIRRCRISGVKCGIYCNSRDHKTPLRQIFIADNDLDGPFAWGQGKLGADVEEWRGMQVTGSGYDICYNRVRGFKDGIDTFPSKYCCAIDIHHNEVLDCLDDGTEMDFSERNNRCFLNRYTNVHQGISEQPIFGGPVYIFRNSLYNVAVEPFKLHHNGHPGDEIDWWPSGAIIYHNTVVKKGSPSILHTPAPVYNCVYRNNLFIGGGRLAMEFTPPMIDCDFDYDGFGGGPWRAFMAWNKAFYKTFDDMKAKAPVERHAVLVDVARLFAAGIERPADVRTRYEPVDLRLAKDSAAVATGETLPGFNDGFPGKAPSLGAYEWGGKLPHYGPRPER